MPKSRVERAAQARESRREELLAAATHIFAKKGYRAASVSDVIEAAGVARGTFYLYFRGKQDILFAVIDDLREQQKAFITQLSRQEAQETEADPRELARRGFMGWLRFYDQRRDALKILLREANLIEAALEPKRAEVRNGVVDYLSKRIRRLQREGVYQEKLSPEVVSHFLIGMVDEIALSYLQKGRKPDLEWLADQCASFELDGLLRRR
ncbi:MAG TPA: helix-turn-helix domain-containing protein [Terriglobales bacterium]|nr:helix-turn-helix domain-containing protein [Terriglobales bacterium]